ncbi:MAG: WhiB family transcriptional regulator [Actinomycetota bacterium]|nr:WhiB family transcriptional regulator [Actinomycetota bacterium]
MRSTWREKAACRGLGPAVFFPAPSEPATEAYSICRGCPVTAECLAYAFDHRITYGVWGGMSVRRRRALRRYREAS